jgi:hypothetical protein
MTAAGIVLRDPWTRLPEVLARFKDFDAQKYAGLAEQ